MNAGIVWWRLFCKVSTSSRNACCTHSASTSWASTLSAAISTSQLKKCSISDELAIHTASASASPLPLFSTHTAPLSHHYRHQHTKLTLLLISVSVANFHALELPWVRLFPQKWIFGNRWSTTFYRPYAAQATVSKHFRVSKDKICLK